jgi:hypothetical protein
MKWFFPLVSTTILQTFDFEDIGPVLCDPLNFSLRQQAFLTKGVSTRSHHGTIQMTQTTIWLNVKGFVLIAVAALIQIRGKRGTSATSSSFSATSSSCTGAVAILLLFAHLNGLQEIAESKIG